MKRLFFAIAAAAAIALAVPIASAATFENKSTIIDNIFQDATFVGHPFDASPNAVTLVAVDNSISKFCRAEFAGSGYQRPGGFCDVIKAYHKTPTGDGNQLYRNPCPAGQVIVENPDPPPEFTCGVPEPDPT